MKTRSLFSLVLLLLALCQGMAQQHSCCSKPVSTADMAQLALVPGFQAAHHEPLPLNYKVQAGKMIRFSVDGGKEGSAFYVPAARSSNKVLLVFHEWWGLNDYIKREAENWQQLLGDADVYAPDLYDGAVADKAEEAGKLMNGLQPERALAIINGLIAHIGPGKQVATIGWCMGGSWSFQAALQAGGNAKACVAYYGFPEKDPSRISTLKTDVLYIRAAQDSFIPKEAVDQFEKDVKASGRNITVKSFDAPHAFANPSNPHHHAGYAKEAQQLALDFIKKGFKK